MFRAAVLIIACAGVAGAHDVITTKITWSKEVSRLVYKRCAMCHREGGSSFSLMTYDEARPWAKAIKEEALERRMPPWEAVKGFGEFKDDRGLTEEELEVISDWVEGGAPEGNPKHLPEQPKPQKWLDGAMPKGSAEVVVSSETKLDAAANVLAIRPKEMKKGASIQVIAARPDGTFEPLLWIYQYNPDYQRTYYFKTPVNLPVGTQIQTSPPDAGKIALFASGSKKTAKPSTGGH
ncbi:MAG TPA: hypothetical protein VNX18_06660 [Bryobacteraceae bacterium]|nr:hypothetical protein [Bryobacteraceae bacterium]